MINATQTAQASGPPAAADGPGQTTGNTAPAPPGPRAQAGVASQNPPTKVSVPLILAATPVAAYGLALAVELGYASVLNIPLEFIQVDLPHLYPMLLALAIVGVVALGYVNFFWPLLETRLRLFITLIPASLYSLALVTFHHSRYREWVLAVGAMAYVELIYLLPPVLQRKSTKPFWQRYSENAVAAGKGTLVNSVAGHGSAKWILLSFVLLLLTYLFFSYGRAEAFDTIDYLVIDGRQPTTVILRRYGNTSVAGVIDDTSKKLTGQFSLVASSGTPSLNLTIKRVGPLKPMRQLPVLDLLPWMHRKASP